MDDVSQNLLMKMETFTENLLIVTIANETRYAGHDVVGCTFNTISEASRWIVCILTLCSNTLTIVTMLKTKQGIGYKGKLYIISLSLADGLMAPTIALDLAFYHFSITCVAVVETDVSSLSNIVQLKRISYVLLAILYIQCLGCSLFTLVCAAVDRLVAVSKPVWYKNHVTPYRIKCLLFTIWIYSFSLSAVSYFYLGWRVTSESVLDAYMAMYILPNWCFDYVIMPHVYVGIVCDIILSICTFYHIRKLDQTSMSLKSKNPSHTTGPGRNEFQRSKRFMRMTMATSGFLLILWTPYSLVMNIVPLTDPANPEWLASYVIPLTCSLMFCNSWGNPVLYCWLNKDYRKAYMNVLGFGGRKASATVHCSQAALSVVDNDRSCVGATVTQRNT